MSRLEISLVHSSADRREFLSFPYDLYKRDPYWVPPLRLDQVTYDAQGRMQYPRQHDRAPESELHRYLDEARNLLQAATPAAGEPVGDLVSPDFEQLRWFDLPPACLSDTTR